MPPGVGACVGPPARGPTGAGKTVPIHSRPASLLPEARRNRPPRLSVAGCATGSARFSSAQLDRGGPLCLYTLRVFLSQVRMVARSRDLSRPVPS